MSETTRQFSFLDRYLKAWIFAAMLLGVVAGWLMPGISARAEPDSGCAAASEGAYDVAFRFTEDLPPLFRHSSAHFRKWNRKMEQNRPHEENSAEVRYSYRREHRPSARVW